MVGDDVRGAARMLRALVVAFPPQTKDERATARRIEGAAVAFETLAGPAQQSADSEPV
jgi:hypothetical protein